MLRFFSRQTAPLPTHAAATYRGCQRGWERVGSARSLSEAERLARLLERLFPDYIHRPIAF